MKRRDCKRSTGEPFLQELAELLKKHNAAICAIDRDNDSRFCEVMFQFYRDDLEEFYTGRNHSTASEIEYMHHGKHASATKMKDE